MKQPLGVDELASLFDLLDAAVLRVNPATLELRIVAGAEGQLGQPSNAPISFQTLFGSCPEHERSQLLAALNAVADDGQTRTVKHRLTVVGRGELWYRTTFRPRGAVAPSEPIAVMLDVTSAHHDEHQWLEVEAWLATLGETLPFDFWIRDCEGRFVLQNPESVRHWGAALGRTASEAGLSPTSLASWKACFNRALVGELVREELDYERDGELRSFARVVAPVTGPDRIDGVLGVDLDITDLKRTAERLQRSLKDLNAAQESLVRSSQLTALGEMAAVVAHEVRNPLGSISNALALLGGRAGLAKDDAELCRIMEDEVLRLDRLVTHLLDFVRPIVVQPVPVALAELVEIGLRQTLLAEEGAERIRVDRVVDPALPPVPVDAQLLSMAFANVLRNAVQAMPEGGELRIEIEREAVAPFWARISISDTGPGIPEEIKSQLFEPFITTRQSGSGLGLSIVRRIVEEHSGQLTVQSDEGRGTTCVIRLPMTQSGASG